MGKHGPVDGSRLEQPSTSERVSGRRHIDLDHESKHAAPESETTTETGK